LAGSTDKNTSGYKEKTLSLLYIKGGKVNLLEAAAAVPGIPIQAHSVQAMDYRPWTRGYLLIIAPLVHPLGLDLFQVAFVGFFSFALEIIQGQHPLDQVGKPDAVDLGFVEFIAELLVQSHCHVFVVPPVHGRLKTVSHIGYAKALTQVRGYVFYLQIPAMDHGRWPMDLFF
jgi:hypothetical protein